MNRTKTGQTDARAAKALGDLHASPNGASTSTLVGSGLEEMARAKWVEALVHGHSEISAGEILQAMRAGMIRHTGRAGRAKSPR